MNSILDVGEGPLSEEQLSELRQYANERIHRARRQAMYAFVALFLSCASVAPFLSGHSLHAYWKPFGKYLVLLSMGLLPVFVYFAGCWWNAWTVLREIKRESR
jgi:hypothetical protein